MANMRTLVDIPDRVIEQLVFLGKKLKASRAELVRQALNLFIDQHKPQSKNDAFGSWTRSRKQTDKFLESIKSEWK